MGTQLSILFICLRSNYLRAESVIQRKAGNSGSCQAVMAEWIEEFRSEMKWFVVQLTYGAIFLHFLKRSAAIEQSTM